MTMRETNLADVPVLTEFRALQLVDEGENPDKDITEAVCAYFRAEMQAGRVHGWLYEHEGRPVAVCSVSTFAFPPTFGYPDGRYAYLQSVYTLPEYRGRGLASGLVGKAVEVYRAQGYKRFFLYASEAGQPVYAKQGFEPEPHFMAIRE